MWQDQAVELKLARLRDAQRIARMSRDLVEGGLPWAWTAPRVASHIRGQDSNVLIAWVGEQFAGFAIMQFYEEDAHLNLFAVDPQYRRCGIGRKLLLWLEETARVGGIFTINLEVRADNFGGRAFYRALGYHEVRTIPGYYSGREAAIRMTRDLRYKP
ncbi:MAG: GNAT family N-acetyltransferase [Deltaproteobacteria bacterium]|nr:GNAT family N-acetyltransferase [Deltaproteobacteria bacterium]